MKVRIGIAAGTGVADDPVAFLGLVDAIDDLGFDSIWVPDIITTATLDPLVALSMAAGRRDRLKLGTHLILPGRDPVMLAKQLASLDQLSNGRLLLLAVLGLRQREELAAQGVDAADRTAMLEEHLTIMRALWAGEELTFSGRHYQYEGARLAVRPRQQPLEVWLGGQVPAALQRCGRIGEGWMPGLLTPEECAAARATIAEAAADAGRAIDDEHYGVNISWVEDRIPDSVREAIARRRPDLPAEQAVAIGPSGLEDKIASYLEVGFSKFVIRPAVQPESWPDAVSRVARVTALQT